MLRWVRDPPIVMVIGRLPWLYWLAYELWSGCTASLIGEDGFSEPLEWSPLGNQWPLSIGWGGHKKICQGGVECIHLASELCWKGFVGLRNAAELATLITYTSYALIADHELGPPQTCRGHWWTWWTLFDHDRSMVDVSIGQWLPILGW